MMKRNLTSRKFVFAVAVCTALMVCALVMEASEWMRTALMLASATVACVWIVSEARVDRAAAPLNLSPESIGRVDKPPEETSE